MTADTIAYHGALAAYPAYQEIGLMHQIDLE
jgi:hypothetical protein